MLQVVWLQDAINDLAEIWNQGDSTLRQEVTRAANAVDQTLRVNPFSSGESREGARRVTFAPPLGISFKVDQDSGTVLVVQVWRIRPPRRRA
jgi:hypothetical protein